MDDEQGNHFEQLQSSITELHRRFEQLTVRLDAIEKQANGSVESSAVSQESGAVSAPLADAVIREVASKAVQATPKRSVSLPHHIGGDQQDRQQGPRLPASRVQRPVVPKRQPKAKNFDMRKLEWILGTRGLALAGVLIVIFSIGSFLKMAVDEGWVAAITPATRCISAGIIGAVFIGVGEFFRRKINPLASSGISAAGIATVYASTLAAAKLYDLVNAPVAFVLLVSVTILGVLLGSLSNRVMLAILSLIGAFVAPVLLATGEPSYVVMPAYLFALLVMGLMLSGWRGGSYARVRQLAWWGTGLIGSLWLKEMYTLAPASSLVFITLVWGATVAELIASSRFFKSLRDSTDWPEDSQVGFLVADSGEKTFDPRSLLAPEARWINALFGATVWAVTAGAMTIDQVSPGLSFLAPLSIAVLSVLIVLVVFVGKRKKYSRQPVSIWSTWASPRSALAGAMVINAMFLGVATIAMAFGGWIQVVAWAIVGLSAIVTANRIRFRAVGMFGFGMILIAVVRLCTYDFIIHMQHDPSFSALGIAGTLWTPQVMFVAMVCVLAGYSSRYRPEQSISVCGAFWILALSLIHTGADISSLGVAYLAIAVSTAWLTVRIPIQALRANAYALAGIGMWCVLIGQFESGLGNGQVMYPQVNVLTMLIVGVLWAALAALPKAGYSTRLLFASLAIISVVVALLKVIELRDEPSALFFIGVFAGVVMLAGKRLVRWSLVEISAAMLMLIACAWGVYELTVIDRIFDGPPVVYFGFGSAIITAVLAIFGGIRLPNCDSPDDAPPSLSGTRILMSSALLGIAWVILFSSSSIEVVRAIRLFFDQGSVGGAGVSIWWSLFAIASVALGFRFKSPPMRWAGLGLLGVVAVKVLFVDTVTLTQSVRLVASIIVGLVIIAAGVLYAKLVETEKQDADSSEPDSDQEQLRDPDLDSDPDQ